MPPSFAPNPTPTFLDYVLYLPRKVRAIFRPPQPVGSFSPSPVAQLLIPIIAFGLACGLYTAAVGWCYRETWRAYAGGNVFDALLEEMPRVFEVRNPAARRVRVENFDPEKLRREASMEVNSGDRGVLTLLFLQKMGLVSSDETFSRADKKDKAFRWLSTKLAAIGTKIDSDSRAYFQRPTVEVIVELALNLNSESPAWLEDKEESGVNFRRELASLTAGMLADYPNARNEYEGFLNMHGNSIPRPGNGETSPSTEVHAQETEKIRSAWKKQLRFAGESFARLDRGFRAGFQLQLTASTPSEEQVLHLLFRQAKLNRVPGRDEVLLVKAPTANNNDDASLTLEKREDVQRVESFLAGLITRMHALPEVKDAGYKMSIARGYEQFFMLWAFLWMTLLLVGRGWRLLWREWRAKRILVRHIEAYQNQGANLKPASHRLEVIRQLRGAMTAYPNSIARRLVRICHVQLKRNPAGFSKDGLTEFAAGIRQQNAATRWNLIWLARAIPALGFIGTVHGISLGLMKADLIVRATTPAAQAAAINLVAGNLGVAFAHTFIALLMGIVLSWWNDYRTHREHVFVVKLEKAASILLDPIDEEPVAPGAT